MDLSLLPTSHRLGLSHDSVEPPGHVTVDFGGLYFIEISLYP